MWFVLGIIVGILLSVAALAALIFWIEHSHKEEVVQAWLDRYQPKGERGISEGHIGTFYLDESDGEIKRVADA